MTDVSICLLGPLKVTRAGALVEVPGRRPRTLLALLAMEAGNPVSADLLADRIWGEELPDNPRGSLHTYIGRLRRVLGKEVVRRAAGGYILDLPRSSVDALAFVDLLDATGRHGGAEGAGVYERLEEAIDLWRGAPFDEPAGEPLAEIMRPWLVDRYLAALEDRASLDVAAGRATKAVADVRRVVADHPLRESLWAVLLEALASAGRTAEALEAYEEVRSRLADELGADPGTELRSIFTRLLVGDVATPEIAPSGGEPVVPEQRTSEEDSTAAADTVPHQLPADVPSFSGRDVELRLLDAVTIAHESGWPSVVVVHGVGAAGKTALAVHWAHRTLEHFPDGQLFIDLRGYGPGEPMDPEQALSGLLIGLGVDGEAVPDDVDAASALLRTTLAQRRVLLVLDNARDAQQVRPLLPGGESLALVTSRSQMRGLAAREGAKRIGLDMLTPGESVAFLHQRLGDRATDQATVRTLAEMCGHLPLALAVAAERCGRHPDVSLAALVAELDGESSRLSALETADDPLTDLRAVFSWSYDALDAESRAMFRRIAVHPGSDLSVPCAAALAGVGTGPARRLLDRLTEANLLREHRPGRFVLHDLVRDYALEMGSAEESEAAVRRLVSWYTHSLVAAAEIDGPSHRLMTLDPLVPDVVALGFATSQQARSWGEREWPDLGLAVRLAVRRGLLGAAYQLVNKMFNLSMRHSPAEVVALQEIGLEAAIEAGQEVDAAYIRNQLGISRARAGDLPRAISEFRAAAEVFRETGAAAGLEMSLSNCGQALSMTGSLDEAVAVLEEAYAVADVAGMADRARGSLIGLAEVYVRMERYQDAVRLIEDEIGQDPVDVESSSPRLTLADALIGLERYTDAEHLLRHELARHLEERSRWSEAKVLVRRAVIERETDRVDQARATLHEVVAILDEVGELDRTELTRERVDDLLASVGDGRPAGRGERASATRGLDGGVALRP
ncbi:AfsR/SARP family transcriptional regulator [Nocardioides albertanoniae]|uniref:AfsR/SARP family transcriptional regulator n=1 Tax=Nocardioides albertanoniae TaxID=1175486 RepID=UPI0014777FA2|nr:BTAD domain-containing putative transcriptional regulator [Nocardioides albertanoniae]